MEHDCEPERVQLVVGELSLAARFVLSVALELNAVRESEEWVEDDLYVSPPRRALASRRVRLGAIVITAVLGALAINLHGGRSADSETAPAAGSLLIPVHTPSSDLPRADDRPDDNGPGVSANIGSNASAADRMRQAQEAEPAGDRVTLLKKRAPDIGPTFEYWVTAWATDGVVCIADALGSTYCEDSLAAATKSTIVLSAGGRVPRLIVRGSKAGLVAMRFGDGTLVQGSMTAIRGAQSAVGVLPYDGGRAGSTVHLSTPDGITVDYDLPVDDNPAKSAAALGAPGAPAPPIEAIPPSPAAPVG